MIWCSGSWQDKVKGGEQTLNKNIHNVKKTRSMFKGFEKDQWS